MKIPPVRAEFFHADGQTDRDMKKLIFASRKFADTPKNSRNCHRQRKHVPYYRSVLHVSSMSIGIGKG